MLVITRRVGEEIVIGPEIRIIVTQIQGNRVRIGISAPKHVCVDRVEVHQRRCARVAETAARAFTAARA